MVLTSFLELKKSLKVAHYVMGTPFLLILLIIYHLPLYPYDGISCILPLI